MRHRDRALQLIPAIVAAAGAALLLLQWAGGRPLWLDEEMIAINLRDRSVRELAGALSLGQTAPYGWLALQRLLFVSVGGGERVLRAVPLLFGIATLAAAAWIGRRWLSIAGATTLVLLCATGRWLTFYFLELKQYSADTCFALLLPALAVRAVEDPRRALTFWIVAAIAQWFANGALFVTPACALVLTAAIRRRDGVRAALRAAAPGGIWLVLFAVHYVVALRHALGSAYLQSTWAFAFPPAAGGIVDGVRWLVSQLAPFAEKPGGTALGALLWSAALAGFVLTDRSRRPLALTFALIPLSAFALALMRMVPLYERLSIWIVPALYVGVALLADAAGAALVGRRSSSGPDQLQPRSGQPAAASAKTERDDAPARLPRVVVGALAAVLAVVLSVDIAARGLLDLRQRPADSNRSLDDRAAIRWLMERAQPEDAWLTTHYALPALWWYSGAMKTDGVFELLYRPDRAECATEGLKDSLTRYPRAVVYLGFRFDDTPPGFDDLLVDRLSELGTVVAYRRFDVRGIGLIVDRRQQAYRPATLSQLDARPTDDAIRPDGCIAIKPALWAPLP